MIQIKRFIFIPILLFMFSLMACATTPVTPVDPTAPIVLPAPKTALEQTQDTATKSVVAMGQVLFTAKPAIINARKVGFITTKEGFNNAVDIYNKALASYALLNRGLQAAITAGKDPSTFMGYTTALSTYTADKKNLDALLTLIGGD
jgi:hypothetical protein